MIRLAQETDFLCEVNNEVLVRIFGLRLTYGPEASFVRYYTDGEGALLAIMDSVGIFHTQTLTDEWRIFLSMNPEVQTIHCSDRIGKLLIESGLWDGRVGDVMKYVGDTIDTIDETVCIMPYLPKVYELLKVHFPGISCFDSWYPDASHRLRHEHSHISTILEGDRVVSTAMTVAETDGAAVLGQVVTHPDFRCRGMAGTCVKSTIYQCEGKEFYILPINENAQKLYEKLGFIVTDGWAELQRI